MKVIYLLKALFLAPFLFLIGGTQSGRAPYFKYAKKKKTEAWLLIELSAADREKLRELANKIAAIEDSVARGQSWIYMKLQVIASCAVNSRGWYIYDPLNKQHLDAIADYPDRLIDQALGAIHELNDMPWIVNKGLKKADSKGESENP